jgi:uncharacterized protein (DUF58 family)
MQNLLWALIALFLFAAFFQLDWAYYLVYVVGGLWIFSTWWIRRVMGRLHVLRHTPERAFVGDTVAASIEFTNASRLPLPWLYLQEGVPLELRDTAVYRTVLGIGGRESTYHRYTLIGKKRGYYTLGPLILRAGDPFGFIDIRWQEDRPPFLIVYPQVVSLQRLGLPSRFPLGTMSRRHFFAEDPSRLAGLRPYSPGDSQRRIHWPATAHENQLLVKTLQPSVNLPVMIALQLQRSSYTGRSIVGSSEWAITVAASLAVHLVRERQSVGLASNGFDPLSGGGAVTLPSRNGQTSIMELLSLLARIQLSDGDEPVSDWLLAESTALGWGSNFILVTPQLTGQQLRTLHALRRRGLGAIALVCDTQPDLGVLQAQGETLGVRVYRTVWESDLEALAA